MTPLFTDDLGAPLLPSVFTLISATILGSFRDLRTCLSLLLWPLTSEYPCLHSTGINSHPLDLGIAHKCCSTSEIFSPTPHFRSQASSSHNPNSTHILSFCPLAVTCPFPSRSRVMIYHFPTFLSKLSTPLTSYPFPKRHNHNSASTQFWIDLLCSWPLPKKNLLSLMQGATTYLWSLTLAGLTRWLGDDPSPHSSLLHTHTHPTHTLSVLFKLLPHQHPLILSGEDLHGKIQGRQQAFSNSPHCPRPSHLYSAPTSSLLSLTVEKIFASLLLLLPPLKAGPPANFLQAFRLSLPRLPWGPHTSPVSFGELLPFTVRHPERATIFPTSPSPGDVHQFLTHRPCPSTKMALPTVA